MATVVFDIETVGEDFEALDEMSKDYFLKFAQTDEEIAAAKDSLSFFPVTAQIVTIGMIEVETNKSFVYFQNGGTSPEKFVEGETTFISGNEKQILTLFWDQFKTYSQCVTFNGRTFDCPFLMLRSAINHIKSGKNIMPYRYDYKIHVDLADQLSFYDAIRRKFGLHMWCRAFGIESPKQGGMSGDQVKDYYKQGRYHDIARYCMADLKATKQLYLYWDKYLKC